MSDNTDDTDTSDEPVARIPEGPRDELLHIGEPLSEDETDDEDE